jgi:DNA repair ATPase RecN
MSDLEYVTLPAYKERMKALDDRINKVEAITEEIRNLTLSVERLTITLSNVVREQESQETRLENIESRDAEMWRTFVKYIITAVAGVIVGFVMRNVGF